MRFLGTGEEAIIATSSTTQYIVYGIELGLIAALALVVAWTTRETAAGVAIGTGAAVIVGLLTVVLLWVPKDRLIDAATFMNVTTQYEDFAKGLIDISNIVYFVSGTALFLVIAVKALESRKWR